MKVFVAVMMDKDSMANHNHPDVLVAADGVALEAKVRAYIVKHKWNTNLTDKEDLTDAAVMSIDMDQLAEALQGEYSDEGYEWSIQEVEM